MNRHLKKISLVLQWLAAATLCIAHNLLRATFSLPSLQLAVVDTQPSSIDKELAESLINLNARLKKLDAIEKSVGDQSKQYDLVTQCVDEVKKEMLAVRRLQMESRSVRRIRPDEVSEDCAKFLGAVVLSAALNQEKLSSQLQERAQTEIKSMLGLIGKTALATSDIPLPTNYAGDVVELVYTYGLARQLGTVFPLSAGTVKLPQLAASPTFTLIAASGTVTEKSPQTAWVTFAAEKFGGLVRLPSEIDEDSIVAMGQFLARYSARQLAQVEDYNFFRSTGGASGQNGTAKGLTVSCNASNDNKVYSQSGSATGGKTKQSDMTLADLRALRAIPNAAVLRNAKYAMHPSYESTLSGFNTSATVQPYQRGMNGQSATLDGFPIVWVPDMPAMSSSTSASLGHVLFGDFTFNYLGVRGGPRFDTSREAGFATDEILVRALERFTIGKMASDCVAVLLNDAS